MCKLFTYIPFLSYPYSALVNYYSGVLMRVRFPAKLTWESY